MDNSFIFNGKICVEENIKITPDVEVGEIQSYCVGNPKIEKCVYNKSGNTYMVNQMLCVSFPLTFSAHVTTDTDENFNKVHHNRSRRNRLFRILSCMMLMIY